MDLIYNLSRRFLIVSLVLLCVVAPLFGWVGAQVYKEYRYQSSNKTDPTSVEKLINKYLAETIDNPLHKVTFVSIKKHEDNWYIATVKSDGVDYKTVLADFGTLQVIIGPGELPVQKNISHVGVPYEIMDIISESAYGSD